MSIIRNWASRESFFEYIALGFEGMEFYNADFNQHIQVFKANYQDYKHENFVFI